MIIKLSMMHTNVQLFDKMSTAKCLFLVDLGWWEELDETKTQKFKNATITIHFESVFEKTHRDVASFFDCRFLFLKVLFSNTNSSGSFS